MRLALLLLLVLASSAAHADYRITRDHGGLVDEYKAKYAMIRDRGERVIIDGICNSACTLVLGIVPLNRICVTPRASLGFHQAYYDKSLTFGREGDELRRHRRPDVVLSGDGEGLDRAAGRAHHRHEEGQERPGAVGHRRSLPGRILTRRSLLAARSVMLPDTAQSSAGSGP